MTAEEFSFKCQLLYGDDWTFELHRRLGISTRSIKRWSRGIKPVPEAIAGLIDYLQAGVKNG